MMKQSGSGHRSWRPALRWRAAPDGSRLRLRPADVLVPAGVTVVSLAASLAVASWHQRGSAVNLAGIGILIASGAALVLRRRYPGTVLGVTLVAALLSAPVGHARLPWLAVIVALFAAVRARRRMAVIATLAVGYLSAVWPPWLIGSPRHSSTFALTLLCGLLALVVAAELVRAAGERRVAARRLREHELLRLAGEERMRIARDLHDVVAHNISVINVQASTALHLAGREPERAVEALSTIREVSGQALTELRTVLGVLRADSDAAPRAPVPGLGQLETLASNMAGAGLTVQITTDGDPVPLSTGADLAAYRIIQEALTNTARHSGAVRAAVRVRYREKEVEIVVEDNGPAGGLQAQPASPPGTGSGIAGMTDRARALGGTLTAGPRPGRGFLVRAVLPAGGIER
jgi:signal transduction histidine kinase